MDKLYLIKILSIYSTQNFGGQRKKPSFAGQAFMLTKELKRFKQKTNILNESYSEKIVTESGLAE